MHPALQVRQFEVGRLERHQHLCAVGCAGARHPRRRRFVVGHRMAHPAPHRRDVQALVLHQRGMRVAWQRHAGITVAQPFGLLVPADGAGDVAADQPQAIAIRDCGIQVEFVLFVK